MARLEALGCDPIEGMARIALDPSNPAELRGRMFAELAGYIAPKRKAVELAVDSLDGPLVPVLNITVAGDLSGCPR